MEKEISEFKSIKFNILIMLFCGLILIGIGVYMNLHQIIAKGYPRIRYTGMRQAYGTHINGTGAIIIGIILMGYPIYIVARKIFKKKPVLQNDEQRTEPEVCDATEAD